MPGRNTTPARIVARAEGRQTRLQRLGYATYAAYLNSPAWLGLRRRYAEERPWICNLCGADEELQLHHQTYERVGEERLDDLVPVCRKCHALIHELERRGTTTLEVEGVIDAARAIIGRAGLDLRAEDAARERQEGRAQFLAHLETLPIDVRLRRARRAVEVGIRRDRMNQHVHILGLYIAKGRRRELILRRLRQIEGIAYRLDEDRLAA